MLSSKHEKRKEGNGTCVAFFALFVLLSPFAPSAGRVVGLLFQVHIREAEKM
jgi:hypothetical protein